MADARTMKVNSIIRQLANEFDALVIVPAPDLTKLQGRADAIEYHAHQLVQELRAMEVAK